MEQVTAKMKTFYSQLMRGEIKSKQLRVLHYLKYNNTWDLKMNNNDIISMKKNLQMSHQSLTASLSLLQDCGLIAIIGQKQYPQIKNSHYSVFEFVEDEFARINLIRERHMEKFQQWLNRGMQEFKEELPSNVLSYLSVIKQ